MVKLCIGIVYKFVEKFDFYRYLRGVILDIWGVVFLIFGGLVIDI